MWLVVLVLLFPQEVRKVFILVVTIGVAVAGLGGYLLSVFCDNVEKRVK